MEPQGEVVRWRRPYTMTNIKEMIHISNVKLDKDAISCLIGGFDVINKEFKERTFNEDDKNIIEDFLEFVMVVQRSNSHEPIIHNLLSKEITNILPYIFNLMQSAPVDDPQFLGYIINSTYKMINLCKDNHFIKGFKTQTDLAILWNLLQRAPNFGIQVVILRLIHLIIKKFNDVHFVLSEMQNFQSYNEEMKKNFLELEKTKGIKDSLFLNASREILNGIHQNATAQSLVHSFSCIDFKIGQSLKFSKLKNFTQFWFTLNTYPRTITFDGSFQFNPRNESYQVHVSLDIIKVSRLQGKNVLKIKFKPPVEIWSPRVKFNVLDTIAVAYATLTNSEIERFLEIFNVVNYQPSNMNLDSDMNNNQNLSDLSNKNLDQQFNQEFKVPDLKLYENALHKNVKKNAKKQKYLETITESKIEPLKDKISSNLKIGKSKTTPFKSNSHVRVTNEVASVLSNKNSKKTEYNVYSEPSNEILMEQTPFYNYEKIHNENIKSANTACVKKNSTKNTDTMMSMPISPNSSLTGTQTAQKISNAAIKRKAIEIQSNILLKKPYLSCDSPDVPNISQHAQEQSANNIKEFPEIQELSIVHENVVPMPLDSTKAINKEHTVSSEPTKQNLLHNFEKIHDEQIKPANSSLDKKTSFNLDDEIIHPENRFFKHKRNTIKTFYLPWQSAKNKVKPIIWTPNLLKSDATATQTAQTISKTIKIQSNILLKKPCLSFDTFNGASTTQQSQERQARSINELENSTINKAPNQIEKMKSMSTKVKPCLENVMSFFVSPQRNSNKSKEDSPISKIIKSLESPPSSSESLINREANKENINPLQMNTEISSGEEDSNESYDDPDFVLYKKLLNNIKEMSDDQSSTNSLQCENILRCQSLKRTSKTFCDQNIKKFLKKLKYS